MFDWTFISHYAPFFVSGAEMTLFISVFGIILAIVVGLVCAGIEIGAHPRPAAGRARLHRAEP